MLDAAGDGSVPPPLLPNSRRLGDERMQVSPSILSGEGVLYDAFRERKLLERYLETAALQNDLTLPDARLLLALWELDAQLTRRELADFTHLSRGGLSLSLQRLVSRGLIKVSDTRKEKERRLDIVFTEAAQSVLEDLETARHDYETARLAALASGELVQYNRLSEKIQAQIRNILQ